MMEHLKPQQIKSHLERNKKKIIAIHGGGNIGLGLMAYIVSKSPGHFNIVATSNNVLTRQLVNSVKGLWLQHDPHNADDVTHVRNVTMISRDRQSVSRLYNDATFAALCMTPTVLPQVVNDIAHGLINRFRRDCSGLKILILMNLSNGTQFVTEQLYNAILKITEDINETKKIMSVNDLIPTVIDRIVTAIPENSIKHHLKEQLIKIDKNRLLSELGEDTIDHIISSSEKLSEAVKCFNLQFNLFNAERQFSMYVPHTFKEASLFPLMKVTHDLEIIEAVKNKFMNGPHAILAWVGTLLGFKTIAESIQHRELFSFIKEMMEEELKPILCAEYPELSAADLEIFANTFFDRCQASVNDLNSRVGRDPMRKLNSGERVCGPLEIARKHNLKISTRRLEQGVTAGLLYAVKCDKTNPGHKMEEIKKKIYQNKQLKPWLFKGILNPVNTSIT